MKAKLFTGIKKTSTVLTTGAVGLMGWGLYSLFLGRAIEPGLVPLLGFGSFVLTAHLIEALVAAAYAPGKQQSPLGYGVYTFFVGTVGLLELFEAGSDSAESL